MSLRRTPLRDALDDEEPLALLDEPEPPRLDEQRLGARRRGETALEVGSEPGARSIDPGSRGERSNIGENVDESIDENIEGGDRNRKSGNRGGNSSESL